MASSVQESDIINKLAVHGRTIDGVKTAYGFAENPDQLKSGLLPAMLFYPPLCEMELLGHHNRWRNTIRIRGMLYVTERVSAGNTLRILENRALVFPQRLRNKFQTESVLADLLSLGCNKAWLERIRYGAGGEFLTYSNTEYIGFVMEWVFQEGL